VTTPRAADDFASIRARLEELRREREAVQAAPDDLQEVPTTHRPRTLRWPPSEVDAGPRRVRQTLPAQLDRNCQLTPASLREQ
jgi:hypothetical protein